MRLWNKKPALGIGIGVGVAGALVLALRYGLRKTAREPIPDDISPAIFARRLSATTHGEMVYHISGSGQPVVFFHGIYVGASSYEWSKVYPRLALTNEVIAPDLVGFGESERPSATMDASDYAESMADFILEVCGGVPPLVVASGLSAGIALLMASRHPERVARLIVLLPTGLKGSGSWRAPGVGILARLPLMNRFVYRNYLSRPPFLRGWLSRFGMADSSHVTEEMVRNLAVCAQQAGAENAILNFLKGRLAFDLAARLPRIPHPVTVLWPERAAGFPLRNGEQIARSLPLGELKVLPESGILAALESPDLVAQELMPDIPAAFRSDDVA